MCYPLSVKALPERAHLGIKTGRIDNRPGYNVELSRVQFANKVFTLLILYDFLKLEGEPRENNIINSCIAVKIGEINSDSRTISRASVSTTSFSNYLTVNEGHEVGS